MFALSFIMIWRAVHMRMMEEDNAIRETTKYMSMSMREEQNLAVKGILSGRDVLGTGSPLAREG